MLARPVPAPTPTPAPDLLVEARFRLRSARALSGRLPPGVEAVQVSTDGERGVYLVTAPDAEALDAALGSLAALAPRVVARDGAAAAVKIDEWRAWPLARIREHGCVVLWPASYADGAEAYRVLAPSRAAANALFADLGEEAEVEVLAVAELPIQAARIHAPFASMASDLTARQLDALRAAIAAGYYEVPRRTGTAALAASRNLSRSTFEEHLRKAERAVLRAFGDLLVAHGALASAAVKRAGRPRRRSRS